MRGYDDETSCYTFTTQSLEHLLEEFRLYGRFSAEKQSQEKTQRLANGEVNRMSGFSKGSTLLKALGTPLWGHQFSEVIYSSFG